MYTLVLLANSQVSRTARRAARSAPWPRKLDSARGVVATGAPAAVEEEASATLSRRASAREATHASSPTPKVVVVVVMAAKARAKVRAKAKALVSVAKAREKERAKAMAIVSEHLVSLAVPSSADRKVKARARAKARVKATVEYISAS